MDNNDNDHTKDHCHYGEFGKESYLYQAVA